MQQWKGAVPASEMREAGTRLCSSAAPRCTALLRTGVTATRMPAWGLRPWAESAPTRALAVLHVLAVPPFLAPVPTSPAHARPGLSVLAAHASLVCVTAPSHPPSI